MKITLKIGLLLSIVLLGHVTFAQTKQDEKESTKTYLDLVLNLAGTNLNYGNSNNALQGYKKSVLGGQLGVAFQAGITPSFSLVTELYFTMKGGKLKVNNPLTNSESTLRLYAFELPVLARFHFSNFHINAGPSMAYNFAGSWKSDGSAADFSFDKKDAGFKHFEAALQAGGGYTFHTKTKRMTLDLRYNYGLTNISYSHEMYNRSFIVSLHISNPWKTNPFGKTN